MIEKKQAEQERRTTPPTTQEAVIEWWVEKSFNKKNSKDKKLFSQLLSLSGETEQPLLFILMGCHDWKKPSWGNPETDRLIGKISKSGKRIQRFAQELTSFQIAIQSLTNTPHHFFLSLSETEAIMHHTQKNMGLVIHNNDLPGDLKSNLQNLSQSIEEQGSTITPFSHLEVIKKFFRTDNLLEIQQKLSTNPQNPHFDDFLKNLYGLDVRHLPDFFSTPNTIGTILLDLISTDYEDDRKILQSQRDKNNPSLVILNPFNNAGNWESRPSPSNLFPTKLGMISQALDINPTLPAEEWFDKAHQAHDKKVTNLLAKLNIFVTIHDSNTKTDAVNKLIEIAF